MPIIASLSDLKASYKSRAKHSLNMFSVVATLPNLLAGSLNTITSFFSNVLGKVSKVIPLSSPVIDFLHQGRLLKLY